MIIDCEKCGMAMSQAPFRLMTKCACGHETWHPIYRGPAKSVTVPNKPFQIQEDKK